MSASEIVDVSVIIPVRNRSAYLPAGIASILGQEWPGTLEIICVDDGSDTNPFEALPDPLPPEVRLFRKAYEGVGAARQYALEKTAGRYIAFNDDDDLWLPGKLERQFTALERHPDLDMIFSDLREFNGEGQAAETLLTPIRKSIGQAGLPLPLGDQHLYRCNQGSLAGLFMTNLPLYFQSVLARHGFIDRIGGMNPLTRSCGDCLDFAVRATHGGVIGYLDLPTFLLRRGHVHMTESDDSLDRELAEFFTVYPTYPDSLKHMLRPWLTKLLSNKGWLHFERRQYLDAAKAYRVAQRHGPLSVRSRTKWMLSALFGQLSGNRAIPAPEPATTDQDAKQ